MLVGGWLFRTWRREVDTRPLTQKENDEQVSTKRPASLLLFLEDALPPLARHDAGAS